VLVGFRNIAIQCAAGQYPPVSQPYLSLEAELHDAFWEAEDPSSELSLMADFMNDHPGRALEIGSGSGRLLRPLLDQGFQIEGLELSPDMIAIGQQRSKPDQAPMIVHAGDMSKWESADPYAALLAPAFTLQLSQDPQATLNHWRLLLQPHGGLYLTVFMPYAELNGEVPENEWYDDHQAALPDGRSAILRTRHRIDHDQKEIHREHHYSITDQSETSYESKQIIRWIDHDEMQSLLQRAGFRLKRDFYDFTQQSIDDGLNCEEGTGIFTYLAERIDE